MLLCSRMKQRDHISGLGYYDQAMITNLVKTYLGELKKTVKTPRVPVRVLNSNLRVELEISCKT